MHKKRFVWVSAISLLLFICAFWGIEMIKDVKAQTICVPGLNTIEYEDCIRIDIYNRLCNGAPGCSTAFPAPRIEVTLPAPWVVVGGHWNGSDFQDLLMVCRMVIR